VDGVGFVGVETVYEGGHYVRKHYLIAGLREQHADKAAADVAAADLNGSFHGKRTSLSVKREENGNGSHPHFEEAAQQGAACVGSVLQVRGQNTSL
jgi:hypothetical protein